jgi:hypothetical protein
MNSSRIALIVCSASLMLGGTAAWAQDSKPKMPDAAQLEKKAKEGMPDMAELQKQMEAMQQAGAPGEMHQFLAKGAGVWECTVKMIGVPGAPETGEKGTMTISMVMGGRYQHMNFKGSFMGMPFEGAGTMGFNNTTGKFEGTWLDNASTATLVTTGTLDKDRKVLTMTGQFADPVTKKMVTQREVTTHKNDNEAVSEFFHKPEDGKETKVMEIVMKRTGPAPAEHGKTPMDQMKQDTEKKMKDMKDKMPK